MKIFTDDKQELLNQNAYNRANSDYYNELYKMSEAEVSLNQDFELAKEYSALYRETPNEDLELSRLVVLRWCLKSIKQIKKSKMELEKIKKRVSHTLKKIK
ncbi:MAG: hypothetical protein IJH20_02110 [Bacilli bacterium]|nr:hypothetical protein [Bacilli bacterium]